jgi:hypothetical protein
METVAGKRILILTERYCPEEFLINDLSLEFVKKGARVEVLTQAPSYPMDRIFSGYKNRWFKKERIHGIQIYRIRTLLGYNRSVRLKILGYLIFSLLTSLVALLIGKRYDFVFVYHTGPATMAMGAVPMALLY